MQGESQARDEGVLGARSRTSSGKHSTSDKGGQSRADPCLFFLHGKLEDGNTKLEGIIALATDDMIHGGTEKHNNFMNILKNRYEMGKLQHDSGKFTGKDFKMLLDGSIMLSQENYAMNIPAITLESK